MVLFLYKSFNAGKCRFCAFEGNDVVINHHTLINGEGNLYQYHLSTCLFCTYMAEIETI